MKLLIINSNTNQELTEKMGEVAAGVARPGTEVAAVHSDWGVSSVEGNYDGLLAAQGTLEKLIENEADYDAFIIGCYTDPGLQSAREVTDKPVYGLAESSMLSTLLWGHKFSILCPLRRIKPIVEDLLYRYGLERRCASIRTVELNVNESFRQREKLADYYLEEGKKALAEGAEVIVLGGAIFAGLDKIVEERLQVPVIEGLSTSVKLAEAFYDLGLKTGKLNFYRFPEKKEITDCNPIVKRVYGSGEMNLTEQPDNVNINNCT